MKKSTVSNRIGVASLTTRNLIEIPTKSTEIEQVPGNIQSRIAVAKASPIAVTDKVRHTEDRVASIAEKISKLNTNLLQF